MLYLKRMLYVRSVMLTDWATRLESRLWLYVYGDGLVGDLSREDVKILAAGSLQRPS